MMDQVRPAEGGKSVAMQQAVQPVTRKFRDRYGVHKCRDDPNKGTVEPLIDHWRTSAPKPVPQTK
jgi:hypothetical protein